MSLSEARGRTREVPVSSLVTEQYTLRGEGMDSLYVRQRLEGLSTQLHRVGDRLLAMETAMARRGERMDTVQYRWE